MPKHSPIRFQQPSLPEAAIECVRDFTERHPVATTASKVILATIAMGGILTIASVVPGVFKIAGQYVAKRKQEERQRYKKLWQGFYRLKKERSVVFVKEKDDEMVYKLTNKGEIKIKSFVLETLEIPTPKKWDGFYRLIVFDIPEKHYKARRALKNKLQDMDCYQMQKSVWVHPFPCEEEIEFLKDFFNLKSCVHVLLVKGMPDGRVVYNFKSILAPML